MAAVSVAPVAVDRIGEGRASKHRQSKRRDESLELIAEHDMCTLCAL
jgi:hypothetical protein